MTEINCSLQLASISFCHFDHPFLQVCVIVRHLFGCKWQAVLELFAGYTRIRPIRWSREFNVQHVELETPLSLSYHNLGKYICFKKPYYTHLFSQH